MARMILISESNLDRLFRAIQENYAYDHKFMHGHESMNDFEGTIRKRLLSSIRADLNILKNDIARA